MPARERHVERLDEILLCESGTPRWRIVATLFGRLVKNSGELIELIVTEFRGTAWPRIIIERGLEAALFEAIQPVVDCLAIPAVLCFDLIRGKPFHVFTGSSKAFDCIRISIVRELLADSTLCEVRNLPPPLPASYHVLSLENLTSSDRQYNLVGDILFTQIHREPGTT
jgi:hypothetical protein